MNRPLMPRATALWLIHHTCLTWDQIGAFCQLHAFEVSVLAEGSHLQELSPIMNNQLTREEITRCEADAEARLVLKEMPLMKKKTKKRYTPLSKRVEIPHAILWLIKRYPSMTDSQISSLLSTTKNMAKSIRDETHWNMAEFKPKDPVILGLCSAEQLYIYEKSIESNLS